VLAALAPCLLILTFHASAEAHAPPYATAIDWVESPLGARAVVRTNRGLIFEGPESGAFRILCSEAFASSLTEIAPFAPLPEGAVFVASYEGGLQRSTPDRCNFEPVADVEDAFIADLQRTPDDSDDLFALALPLDGSAAQLFNRQGKRAPWVALATLEGAPDSVRVAAARSDRVYLVTMRSEGERQLAEVLRSSDHGKTFSVSSLLLQEHEIRAYVLGADQADPERVFLRTQTADGIEPERLLLSEDGGVTFREVLSARGPLTLASRADDDAVWAGGFDGLFRSQDGGSSFTRVEDGPERIECLRLHEGKLYACGYAEGEFGVLVSNASEANEFSWFLRFPEVKARVDCPVDSDEGLACQYPFEDWAAEQLESREPPSEDGPVPPVATASPPSARTERSPESAGCSLRSERRSTTPWAFLAYAVALLIRHARLVARHPEPSRAATQTLSRLS
jgi:hypothetical protein